MFLPGGLILAADGLKMQHSGPARVAYAEEMRELEHDLLDMGTRAEQMVLLAVDSLARSDGELAMEVLRRDDDIDQRDLQIEARCLRLLALQQPMARDLRTIGTAMKMITDIERIGDLAVDVAKIGLKIEKEFGNSTVVDVPRMANVAREMLREALQAYITRDLAMVRKVVALEDDVDAMYRELRTQLFDDMRKDSRNVVADGWLLLAIHHVERIADHSLNIAERVYFMETGELYNFAAHRASLGSQNSHEQQV